MHGLSAGVLVSILSVVLAACDNSPTPPSTPVLDVEVVQQLFARMDRLVTALEAVPAAAAGTERPPLERTLVTDDREELLQRIETLEQTVTTLRARGGMAPVGRRAAPPVIRPAAVVHLNKQVNSKDESTVTAMRRAHFRMTEEQILQQYGMPSEVIESNSGVTWTYTAEGETSGFVFVNGLVARIW